MGQRAGCACSNSLPAPVFLTLATLTSSKDTQGLLLQAYAHEKARALPPSPLSYYIQLCLFNQSWAQFLRKLAFLRAVLLSFKCGADPSFGLAETHTNFADGSVL